MIMMIDITLLGHDKHQALKARLSNQWETPSNRIPCLVKCIKYVNFQEIPPKTENIETWCKDCGVVEPLVPCEVETNFQAAVISSPLLLLVTVQSLVVDHVGVVVPVVG